MPHVATYRKELLVEEAYYADFSEILKPIFNSNGVFVEAATLPVSHYEERPPTYVVAIFNEKQLNEYGKRSHTGWVGKEFSSNNVRHIVFPDLASDDIDNDVFQQCVQRVLRVDLDIQYKVATTRDDIAEVCKFIHGLRNCIFDFETRTKVPHIANARILSVAVGNRDFVWVVPLQHKDSPFLDQIELQDRVLRAISSHRRPIAFNAKFELRWMKSRGFDMSYVHFDPMIVHHLLNETVPHNLTYLTHQYAPTYSGYDHELEQYITEKNNYESAPIDVLLKYNACDVVVTDLVGEAVFNELSEYPKILWSWENLHKPLIPVLAEMEHSGFTISKPELVRLINWYESEQTKCENVVKSYPRLRKFFGERPDFNFSSYPQMQALLYDELKFPVKRRTKKTKKGGGGNPSVDEEALKQMKQNNRHLPVIDMLLRRAKVNTQLKSFLYVFFENCTESNDHRLHTNYNVHVVETYRLSSSEPNLQNMPRSEDLERIGLLPIKSAVISRFPKGKLIQADHSQIELRIAGMYSGDPVFHEAYKRGLDLHGQLAEKVYGPDFTKDERTKAKRTNFSVVFDVSAHTLSEKLEITEAEAQKLIDQFKSIHTVLYDWFDQLWGKAMDDGYTENFVGERRRIAKELKEAQTEWQFEGVKRQVWNFPIQSSAADIMKHGLITLHKRLKDGDFKAVVIGTIHDSVIVDCPKSEVKSVAKIIRESLESSQHFFDWVNIPLKADVSIGDNLYKMEDK